ncbi:hypothetical protein [Cystobacter ferrugineus]|uniref:Cell wall anchor protein n=1 Tax=Cystobacter ferrugineus TaxID=83449 RepID=A0A1L9B243_9BACT|nr:hypothetical protein [Cystobacter ferrugineus]OJH36327.1 hypothetical protein BON30_34840 [Cystobacter ferrugineus]
MTGKNTKRFALVGMLAGAMILSAGQAGAQAQSGAQDTLQGGSTTQGTGDATTRDQNTLPPDVIDSQGQGTGGAGAAGSLPSQDDAIDPSQGGGNTTLNPGTQEPNTGTSGSTVTPDADRNTTLDPGTGGSGTSGTGTGSGSLGTGGSGTTGSDVGTGSTGTGGSGSDLDTRDSGTGGSGADPGTGGTGSDLGTGGSGTSDSDDVSGADVGQNQDQVNPDSMYKSGSSATTR